jgi:Mn-containing catalase
MFPDRAGHRAQHQPVSQSVPPTMPGPLITSKNTGELDVDLRSNIAAEARAKIVYERLIDFCDD